MCSLQYMLENYRKKHKFSTHSSNNTRKKVKVDKVLEVLLHLGYIKVVILKILLKY